MSEPDQSNPPPEGDVPPDVTPVVIPGPTGQPAEGTVEPVPTVTEGPPIPAGNPPLPPNAQ